MDEIDIIALFGMDDGEHERNNAIRVLIDELMEPLLELEELRARQRYGKARNENYYENIIPQYDDLLFKEHFRMSRAACEVIYITFYQTINYGINFDRSN